MKTLDNYFNGNREISAAAEHVEVVDPATGEVLARTPLSTPAETNAAVQAAAEALADWRRVPAPDRIQYLFKMKVVLEENLKTIGQTITRECGKTLGESIGEMRRAIENVEVACGIPKMLQGHISEDIASGIDELMLRQPVGVCAIIAPFNFPGMIPFWFLPYALACGNTCVIKPSEKTPITMDLIFHLIQSIGLPRGVLNMVHGARDVVDGLLDHPNVKAVSFVGSTPVARTIYRRAAENGKRVQAQGGAKNPLVVLPDADIDMAVRIGADSAFGCAGQRCLATSLAVTVGDAHDAFIEGICEAASSRRVGYGLDPEIQMGAVINHASVERIEGLIQAGVDEGARPVVDGRGAVISGYEKGSFVRPTVLLDVPEGGTIATTEIFGPVLGVIQVDTLDHAIELINRSAYGNQASLFTTSGASARKFRYEVQAGNIGINIGVAAPMAFFPFSGWKDSFFGDLHGQGADAVDFFTQKKIVVERWPKDWTRQF
ncbi:MAG: CoA-acylating methylmalonate-semialdehyde dehydrogenase [Anaerolineales bacterium]|nr:CoA-acylating methylmalonate-semialdehyde dehydrogenase [Anaerolineales bacterium]